MNHFLTRVQQGRLILLGNAKSKGLRNIPLEQELVELKQINPDAFHDAHSLGSRAFYHQPGPYVPYKYFIIANARRL